MNKIELYSGSPEFTRKIGEKLAEVIFPPYNVLLRGELGAGKTELVRGFLAKFGFLIVRSPSFTIVNTFKTPKYNVHHIDLFRITNLEEITIRGIFDLLEERDSIRFVEWPELILDYVEKGSSLMIDFEIIENTSRKITLTCYSSELYNALSAVTK
ncbi:MAG: tRNA (adenosine(37)-N6)-threonylcarbamoyltransferase complex ATPase subunit type 1 TsaE [candidate division WOR-3 bacterium]